MPDLPKLLQMAEVLQRFIFSLGLLIWVWSGMAQPISFHGELIHENGLPFADGIHSLEFHLYDGMTANASLLWAQAYLVQSRSGRFEVVLDGGGTDLPALGPIHSRFGEVFQGRTVFLRIFDAQTGGQIGEPKQVLYVPQAIYSDQAGKAKRAGRADSVSDAFVGFGVPNGDWGPSLTYDVALGSTEDGVVFEFMFTKFPTADASIDLGRPQEWGKFYRFNVEADGDVKLLLYDGDDIIVLSEQTIKGEAGSTVQDLVRRGEMHHIYVRFSSNQIHYRWNSPVRGISLDNRAAADTQRLPWIGNMQVRYNNVLRVYDFKHYRGPQRVLSRGLYMDTTNVRLGVGSGEPTETLHVNGNIRVNGEIRNPSDRRLKQDIQPLGSVSEMLKGLNPVSYAWRRPQEEGYESGRQIGLIAQEVEEVIPQVVSEFEDGFKGVNYLELVPVLIGALKEQQERIEALESVIAERAGTGVSP